MAKKILFIGGSLNQTTMMHRVARELPEYEHWFTPYYADGFVKILAKNRFLDFTILGGGARRATEAFLYEKKVQLDDRGARHNYDLVVTCSDLIVPKNIRNKPFILVQEGMLTPENAVYHTVKNFRLPRYLGNTSMTGLSHAYQKFCVASEGFRDIFIRKGVDPERIVVTGIPNFDDLDQYKQNVFPYRDFVLGATSCLRESFQYENRPAFIRKVLGVADGRQVIFKLHPNENHPRALREIERYGSGAITFTGGNVHHMIANCSALVTKYSSVMLVALGMDKPVHSDLEPTFAEQLRPVQNRGTSAKRIADICRHYL
ncbi:MAG: hypothetical protein IPJ82_08665 [Lewinellaceae bacterium]|nr:hypothetical protein [Lewinellaceae bacterium]